MSSTINDDVLIDESQKKSDNEEEETVSDISNNCIKSLAMINYKLQNLSPEKRNLIEYFN